MSQSPDNAAVLRAYLLPALLLFALPAVGIWFAGHAERSFDEELLSSISGQLAADKEMTPEEKAEASAFYSAIPPSLACADTSEELANYRAGLGKACDPYWHFGWIRRLGWAATGVGLFSAVVILLSALLAFSSRPAQFLSLKIGWNVLRVTGAVETVLQGTLAVFLSYWMTAVWFESYYPKLIIGAAALALAAVAGVVMAIFRRPPHGLDVEGELIDETAAPELWARIRQICAQLQTAPPAQVVVGIDDNFFVTESQVRVGEHTLEGRTLYLSLSLLKTLQRSEADAILAHEMAHFSGGDTAHSRKLAPLLTRFGHYLQALYQGAISRPVFHFMNAYYGLFQLSLSKSSRARELAADTAAAQLTSAQDIARSLVKVGAYSSYRERVEAELFEKNEQHGQLAIADRVLRGFRGYVQSEKLNFDLHGAVTPHPFDSHPPLQDRLANVGVALSLEDCQRVALEPVESSWVAAILGGDALERKMWAAYEARFNAAHDLMLAYRYRPDTDLERAHVVQHFPPLTFVAKKEGGPTAAVDFEKLSSSTWDGPVPFEQIKKVELEDNVMGGKTLKLTLKEGGVFSAGRKLDTGKLAEGPALLEAFNRYFGRHQAAVQYQLEQAAAVAPAV